MSLVMTLKKLARLAGVTPSTVSRVLNPATRHLISPAQCQRIQALCDQHGYRPQLTGRSFVTGKTYKVGLVLGALERDLSSPLFSLYIRGLCDGLQAANYALTILWAGAGSDESAHDHEVQRFLMSGLADAYILGAGLLRRQVLEPLERSRRPIMGLNQHFGDEAAGMLSVILENHAACREILRGLSAEECRGLLFFGARGRSTDIKHGFFNQAAVNLGLDLPPFTPVLYTPTGGGFCVDREQARHFAGLHMEQLRRARVIVCASDLTAMGLCDALRAAGVRVGEEIKVIGHDNLEAFPGITSSPWLSTVDPQQEEAGRVTARAILEAIDDPEKERVPIRVAGVYVERISAQLQSSGGGQSA